MKVKHVKDTERLIQQLSKDDPKVKIFDNFGHSHSFKALKEIIFIFMIYSRPSRTRWYTFQKNSSQKFFIKIIESPLGYGSYIII